MTETRRHTNAMPYMTQEMTSILGRIKAETGDETLASGIFLSPTAITHIRRIIEQGGTIVTDTTLVAEGIDKRLMESKGVKVLCFIDDPQIRQVAEHKGITRAEVAVDNGLAIDGLKLMVVGSAPAALGRIIARRRNEPMSDVCVLAATTGFASAVQIKERLIESSMACIVARGKQGGVQATIAILNAVIGYITETNPRTELPNSSN